MEYPPDKPVLLKQIANDLGFHASSIRKAIVRRGYVPFRLSGEPNKPLFLRGCDAEAFTSQILLERAHSFTPDKPTTTARISGVYFVEVPSYDGIIRIKIGWSDNFSERYSTYRTIVPDLRVMGFWATTDAWTERAALKCADNLGRRIHQELFEFEDNVKALDHINDLFQKLGINNKVSDILSQAINETDSDRV